LTGSAIAWDSADPAAADWVAVGVGIGVGELESGVGVEDARADATSDATAVGVVEDTAAVDDAPEQPLSTPMPASARTATAARMPPFALSLSVRLGVPGPASPASALLAAGVAAPATDGAGQLLDGASAGGGVRVSVHAVPLR
jgi:hypothetical protein